MSQRQVFIYLPNLAGGGAERLTLNLLPRFREAGYEPSLVLNTRSGALLPYVPEDIRIISLNASRSLKAIGKLSRLLIREQPDILLSNLGHNNIIALWSRALSRASTKVVVCQHSVLSQESLHDGNWQHRILPAVSTIFLRLADGIVAVSRGVADDMARILRLRRSAISVIYNPVLTRDFDARASASLNHAWFAERAMPVVLGVGRLVPEKDFGTLIKAFSLLRRSMPCKLVLVGDGPARAGLTKLCQDLSIAADVDFVGFQENPLPFIQQAALLVMSSTYEGFGNVLAEAMGCGTPVISTDCPYGPAEILGGGRFGALVPVGDAERMAQAMQDALANPLPADILKNQAAQFRDDRVSSEYVALFDRLLQQRS
ncbi:glycosyltransferase [Dongia soli]|uniref:Glycosyltransferase n=1 Tax=Dongia soli TaxID=600628 RepID=A0ABU5EDL8_9PROT|nr:glycosyltransferase [Dongia soli]MDY0884247.1 glycosyltransferase [Dongia soli]